jgi:hypothetical protein
MRGQGLGYSRIEPLQDRMPLQIHVFQTIQFRLKYAPGKGEINASCIDAATA